MRAGAGDLTLKLVPWNWNIIAANNPRLHHTPPFFLQPYRMADKGVATGRTSMAIESKLEGEKKEKPSPKEIPPPPEKPLPGDCCGSGCVRCVWDLYYEELDEYNKLCKQDPEEPKS